MKSLFEILKGGTADSPITDLVPRKSSPQARHHFTRFDQVDQLVGASEADPDVGFMARLLALCSLPRTNPHDQLQYKRTNGPYTLYMTAGGGKKLPFGNIPRLLIAWVTTEAVQTQSPVLVLGHSLSEFMRKLGMKDDSGSRRGERIRLRNQMQRLFSATIQFVYEDREGDRTHVRDTFTSPIARRSHLVWNPKRPNEPVLWESTVELGQDFFQDIIRHPVPLDMNTLKALSRSPLGLDLYMWLVYRTFSLDAPKRLSWPMLYRQFGADPAKAGDNVTIQNFRKDCLRELKKIKFAWDGLEYRIERGSRGKKIGALVLLPSEPAIPPPLRLGQ